MTKKQIIRTLEVQLEEQLSLIDTGGAKHGTKAKIKRLEDAIEVIKNLPPQCKLCNDLGFSKNNCGEIIHCPDCNAYGERY